MAKPAPTFFQERKAFISRMIKAGIKIQYGKEQNFAKKLFEEWPLDFLNKVKAPFEMNSLAWFLTKDGKKLVTKFPYESELFPGSHLIVTAGDIAKWNHQLHNGKILKNESYQKMINYSNIILFNRVK